MNVSQPSGLTPNPGVELVHIVQQPVGSRIFVIDLEGNVLWFYEYDESLGIPTAFTVLPNGNFLAVFRSSQASLAREIDLVGNIVREVTREEVNQALVAHGYEPLAQVSFHHDALVSPNGNFLLITNYRKEMMVDGVLINVLGDAVVEIDDELKPVWVWSAFDHLDINRHPLSWFDPRWNWNHTNAILYSQADRNLILSMNNQVWILKLDYQDGLGSGKVLWRLGWQGDFTLLNGTVRDFAFSQHGPSLVEDRAGFFPLAVFDNGDARVLDDSGTMCGPETEPCYSRAVIFELDENLRTARVAWEQRSPALSPILGNAQVLPNGNVEYVVGTTNDELGALVQEVTQEQDPKVVWKLFLPESLVYRARRLPSLYPGVQW
ncbi:MAG: aryl-sulfate sulfotransferase [Gemmataceae bacterium]|nr:aryl-sulfate sulfotransferase [Gemmataceae bacterium]